MQWGELFLLRVYVVSKHASGVTKDHQSNVQKSIPMRLLHVHVRDGPDIQLIISGLANYYQTSKSILPILNL